MFLAAAVVDTYRVAKQTLSVFRAGSFFTIEMLMTFTVAGAVANLVKLSHRMMAVVRQNSVWALGLKAVFLVITGDRHDRTVDPR